MKKCLIVRYGAYGDMVIINPVIRHLKGKGYYIILNTSERGIEIAKNDPNIDDIIPYKSDSVRYDDLEKHWKKLRKKVKPDKFINFSESIEKNISLHPSSPIYNWPKYKRKKYAKMNFYEKTFEWAGVDWRSLPSNSLRPEIYLTEAEEEKAQSYIRPNCKNLVWGLSGSGKNKAWPWVDQVVKELIKKHDDIHIIFVGDESCQILEQGWNDEANVTCLSGKIKMRESIALTKYCDLTVAPDTGLLHGAGCFNKPKMGLLGHTTKENITKHFLMDYSIEADPENAECARCARLIYDNQIQCPTDPQSGASFCMQYGIDPTLVYNEIERVLWRIL